MGDRTDTANVIVRPPIAWALAVLARLNWLMPLPFAPAMQVQLESGSVSG